MRANHDMYEGQAELVIQSPVGPLLLRAGREGLTHLLYWRSPSAPSATGNLDSLPRATAPDLVAARAVLERAQRELQEYFAGTRHGFGVPLHPSGSAFQREVWAVLRTLPCGTFSTYKEVAARVGRPSAVRAVGAANGANPISIIVPCHRVVGTGGRLTGYGGGLDAKRWLLQHEGLMIERDRVAAPRPAPSSSA